MKIKGKRPIHAFETCGGARASTLVFGDNYFSFLATITIPFDEVQESFVFDSVVVVGDPLWARFAASKR
jgi:hypothetical protein